MSDMSVTLGGIGGAERKTLVVTTAGAVLGELENAQHGPITWALNQPETAQFTMQADDTKASLVLGDANRFREVQLWRGDQLLVWGPIIRVQADGALLLFTVAGPAWYLTRRHIGLPERYNLLIFASGGGEPFTNGLMFWNAIKTKYFFDVEPAGAQVTWLGSAEAGAAIEQDMNPVTLTTGTVSGGETYTVVPGDTLWGIADSYYGSGLLWPKIYGDNQAQIEADARAAGLWDPNDTGHWIFPGQTFSIPDIEAANTFTPSTTNREWGAVWFFQEQAIEGGERGAKVTFSAWCKIRYNEFTGYGPKKGLYLARHPFNYKDDNFFTRNGLANSLGGWRGQYSEPCEAVWSNIDELHPFDRWVRHEVQITVPPGEIEYVTLRLCSVDGRTMWRYPRATVDSAEEYWETDQRDIVAGLVTHAQDTDYGKSDVNLTVAEGATGVTRDAVYFHHDHQEVWQAITDMALLDDGFDVFTQITTTARQLVLESPQAGSYKPGLRISLGGTMVAYNHAFDGEAAANSIGIVSAFGSGAGREEGSALDAAAFADGLILEYVVPAQAGTTVDRLDSLATEELAMSVFPETLEAQVVHEDTARLFGRLRVGDWIPADLSVGGLTISATYRVVSMSLQGTDAWGLALAREEAPT